MKSSDISSKKTARPSPSSATQPRKFFALAGPTLGLDPRTHPIRRDLADIRLAERVFAPHYAAPMEMRVTRPTPLLATAGAQAEVMAHLHEGELFDVLEIGPDQCWGQRHEDKLVGYIARDALTLGETA